MPGFMQESLLARQKYKDKTKNETPFGAIVKKVSKSVISLVMVVIIAISAAACGTDKKDVRISTQIVANYDEQDQQTRNNIVNRLERFSNNDGTYKSFLYSSMFPEDQFVLEDNEVAMLQNLQNLYDQSLAALVYLQDASIDKANGNEDSAQKKISKAESILTAINSHDILFKSNREQEMWQGETFWVGIAATQYKLVTGGSTKFDSLIKKVDNQVELEYIGSGFFYGKNNVTWASTEHQLDAIAYYTLKIYCDEKYGTSVDFNVYNRLRKICKYLRDMMYDEENKTFYRGHYDTYHVLDTMVQT